MYIHAFLAQDQSITANLSVEITGNNVEFCGLLVFGGKECGVWPAHLYPHLHHKQINPEKCDM
jgi:hypothetical protein